ncbi:MAG: response regulator [Kiritimatiellales bacterium]|nr:response regulator [Kiritimatiellales bacterium]
MKILVAEDNVFSRTLLKKTLTKAGYDVVAADNGESAWEVLRQEDTPRLALIDWMMPGLSGVELCRRVREADGPFPTYLILLTARTGKEDVLEGFSAGADDFIKKPFDSSELLARIQVGRRLVEQHALLRCLVDSIPDQIYFKDNRGTYLGCNAAYAEFIGKELSEIISHTDHDIMSEEKAQELHHDDLMVLTNGEPCESEGWTADAHNRELYLNTLKTPYLESEAGATGMVGINRDLTRRVRMEEEMRRLAVAVEQSTESIIITAVDGKILYVNAAWEKITGYSIESVQGKTPHPLKTGKHDPAFYKKFWTTILGGNTWEGRFTNRKKNGDLYDVEMVVYPIRDDDQQVINYVGFGRDITQEMEIEKQLRQTQKMNAIGKLAGGIAHDFNNILTAILGYVALSMNEVSEESTTYSYLKEIVKAGDRATQLVRQILSFSRKDEQSFTPISIQPILTDSINLINTAMKPGMTVDVDMDQKCGLVLGDPTQIQQIFVNLGTNALQAMADNPGTLKISLKQVELQGKIKGNDAEDIEPGSYACITVSDTGYGMAQATMDRIFEPYFTTKEAGVGTGIGLSIVHGIIQKHRGYITVESKLGEGTSFSIYFPLIVGHAVEDRPSLDLSSPKGHGRLLLVDDDDAILKLGREIMESFGYTVLTQSNGETALEIFRLKPDSFDAIVTDQSMPRLTGKEMARGCLKIRPDIPIIICSGYADLVTEKDQAEIGFTQFMTKPTDWRELSRVLQREINKKG